MLKNLYRSSPHFSTNIVKILKKRFQNFFITSTKLIIFKVTLFWKIWKNLNLCTFQPPERCTKSGDRSCSTTPDTLGALFSLHSGSYFSRLIRISSSNPVNLWYANQKLLVMSSLLGDVPKLAAAAWHLRQFQLRYRRKENTSVLWASVVLIHRRNVTSGKF